MKVILKNTIICFLIFLLSAPSAWAEAAEPVPPKDAEFFAQGTRFWSVLVGRAEDEATELGKITLSRFTIEDYIQDNLALIYGIGLDYVNAAKVKNGFQWGPQLGLRKHFIKYGKLSIYIDGLVGLVYHQYPLEEGSYHVNFDVQAGFGATYRMTEKSALRGGYRHFHMSNAGIGGRERNLGYDAPMFYVGFMRTF